MGSKNVKLTEAESKRVVARSWVVSKWGYADNTTLMAESEEELKSLLMKEESEKVGLKLRSWHPVLSLHGK